MIQKCIKICLGTDYDPNRMTIGTHSLRKTGFLFAIFGIQNRYDQSGQRSFAQSTRTLQPIEDVALLKSARHHCKTDTSTYHQDALTLYADLRRQPTLRKLNMVSNWEPIWVEDVDFRKNTDESTSTDMNIVQVANFFVEKELNISVNKPSFDGIIVSAMAKKKPLTEEEAFEQLVSQLESKLGEEDKKKLWAYFQKKVVTVLHVPASAGMDLGEYKAFFVSRRAVQAFSLTGLSFFLFQMTMKKTTPTTKETTETTPRKEKGRGKGRSMALSATPTTETN